MHASLNLAYRLVWSELRNTWVAVAETAKARGKGGSRAMTAVLLAAGLSCAGSALAAGWVDNWNVTTGNWATGSNWLDGSAPTSADDAIISNGGTALLTTAGSAYQTYLGYGTGFDTLNISNGGVLSNTFGYIGLISGGTGIVTVDGTGSAWNNSSSLFVGYDGTGTLTISNGGTVSNVHGYIGADTGSTGTVIVDGAGSTWDSGSYLYVGYDGTGTLTISNDGTVSNVLGYIGASTGTGTVIVDGANSTWTNSNSLFVGNDGTGTLTIRNGGVVSDTHGYIGRVEGSIGTVTVDGAGSAWTNSANFVVGESGTGTITISNGGTVSDIYGYIGLSSGSTGTVIVDGTGSTWTNSSDLGVGYEGTAVLTIRNGGTVSNTFGNIGLISGSTGTVTVGGTGSTWTNSSDLRVGAYSTGTLNISNGGVVSSVNGFIGWNTGSTGTVTVDGANSAWNNSVDLAVGYFGTGTLTISNGGTVSAGSGLVNIGYNGGSIGTLNIGAAQGSAAVAAGNLNAGLVTFNSGTDKLVFNHTNTDYVFTPNDINGAGAIGLYAGTTRFAGSLSAYTGTMTVDGGTLNIADAQTMVLGGAYTQTANGTLQIGASSATSYGSLNVTGQATFAADSGLKVNVAGTNTLANGNTLTNVVLAGNLTASTFTVTDNSALFNFTATVTEGANGHIDLNTVAAGGSSDNGSDSDGDGGTTTPAITVLSSVRNAGFTAGEGAARVLDIFVQGGTIGTDFDNIVTALGQLPTEAKVAGAVAQTLPLMSAGLANVAVNTLHSTNRVVQARQNSNHGLSSGDEFLGNKKFWLKPLGSWTRQDNRKGVAGYLADTYGLIAGIDGEINEANRIGVAVSYMASSVDGKSTSSGNSADVDAYQAIVYGSRSLSSRPDTELNWQADLGLNKNNGRRAITFGGLNRVAKADYDSTTAHIGAGIARSYQLNDKTTVTPALRADYTYIRDKGYTEKGADALNLKVKSHSTDELIVMAEGRLSRKLNDKAMLVANAGIGYDVLDGKNSITASYVGGGAAFRTQGMDASPWLGRAGLGLTINATETIEITAKYDLEARSDFLDQTASAKVRWAF